MMLVNNKIMLNALDHDGAEPTANSVSAGNLVRLNRLLNRPDYAEKAKKIFGLYADGLQSAPASLPQMATAAAIWADPGQQAS